jgi:formylglycine-generating enzyme required for sulfatase activity
MAKHPVTNRWYRKFMAAGGYNPENWKNYWTQSGIEWLNETQTEHPGYWFDYEWNCDNHPVVGVCWYEADAFCRWLTKTRQDGYTYRLPSEKEWEATAAGKKSRAFAWGNKFDQTKCNTSESRVGKTSAVGIFKKGNTPDGLSDMSGNVWEWTCTNYDTEKVHSDFKYSEIPALRGGSWHLDRYSARCDPRFRLHPSSRYNNVGFRCSRTKN